MTMTNEECRAMAFHLIKLERERQINEEGWTEKHDDTHINGELGKAAARFIIGEPIYTYSREDDMFDSLECICKKLESDKLKSLIKAGALLVAEIERLSRNGLLK